MTGRIQPIVLVFFLALVSCSKDNVAYTPTPSETYDHIILNVFVLNQTAADLGNTYGCEGVCNEDNYGVIGANIYLYSEQDGEISDEEFLYHQSTDYHGNAYFPEILIQDYVVVVESPLGHIERVVEFRQGGNKQLQFFY